MSKTRLISQYIKYYFRAKTRYSIHSPFVYEFCEDVLDDEDQFYDFRNIENVRKGLLKSTKEIEVTDFGAGSHVNNNKKRKIKDIAKSALSPASQCQILFKMIHRYRPETMLEFGTSLGVAALYQGLVGIGAQFVTLEGCPNIAGVAQFNFNVMKADHIELMTGRFEQTLPLAIQRLKRLDYVFFDGNHKKEPTLAYFNTCLPYAHENSIFVFDDIYWSEGMTAAWEEIKKHPDVTLTIDLFFMGIVFFRKENKEKQHFTLIPSKLKFWDRRW